MWRDKTITLMNQVKRILFSISKINTPYFCNKMFKKYRGRKNTVNHN